MVQIELKVKHYYYITNLLMSYQADESFHLLKRIKMQVSYQSQDDDLITVGVDATDVKKIFARLSSKPEGEANRLNSEMMDLLTPQIQAGLQSGVDEWNTIYLDVTAIREANWANAQAEIDRGKNFLNTP